MGQFTEMVQVHLSCSPECFTGDHFTGVIQRSGSPKWFTEVVHRSVSLEHFIEVVNGVAHQSGSPECFTRGILEEEDTGERVFHLGIGPTS